MKRLLSTESLVHIFLCVVCGFSQVVIAQEATFSVDSNDKDISIAYDVESFNFFDNREVHSPYQISQTLFGSRLDAEVGLQFDANKIMVGVMGVKDFGQSGIAHADLTFYYHYEEGHFSGAFGAFPRKRLKRDLPDIFVYDSIRYYYPLYLAPQMDFACMIS